MREEKTQMAPKLKKPATDPVWPPKFSTKKVEVTAADDWWILAAMNGRSDPWDLIVYNFQTRDCNEVNWCLHHLLGCRRTTKDGRNYEFGAPCTQKQHIYIPNPAWKPPTTEDEDAWYLVSSVLNSGTVKGMNASVGEFGLSISGYDFSRIGYLVNTKRIAVRLDLSHPHAAEYVPDSDTMIISTLDRTAVDRSMIVHEAVHASFDYRRSQGVYTRVIQEECFCYIVQMLYLQKILGDMWPSHWVGFAARDTWHAAWQIATEIRTGGKVTPQQANALRNAYQASPAGNGVNADKRTDHNGIR